MFNGDLKSLRLLWTNLARIRRYRGFISEVDITTFERRLDREGLPFLTVALPEIGRALDRYHSTNMWFPPEGFKADGDGIPIFMGVAIRSAIDGNSAAVDCVRQLSYIFYKLEVTHDEERVAEYLDQFINTDKDLGCFDYDASAPLPWLYDLPSVYGCTFKTGDLIKEMRSIIEGILRNEDPFDITPKHGSGATACHTPNWDKYHKFGYYAKLDASFPYDQHFFVSPTHLSDEIEKLVDSSDKEPCARVCLVPKDSRGPRVISCEPAEFMFIQQGIMSKLYEILENHHLTKGRVNFTDQGINRNLAHEGSLKDNYSTLDLKDASDRVSLELVRRVFPADWVQAFEACRSEETLLPNKVKIKLNKFAPMGSACCFPVEALVFWSCAVAALRLTRANQFGIDMCPKLEPGTDGQNYVDLQDWIRATSRANQEWDKIISTWYPEVYVYGDDIICRPQHFAAVVGGLQAVGLKVNREKSYEVGPFRESCGGDYHYGMDVTPVRVREGLSKVGTGLQSSADLANEFIAKFGEDDSHKLIRVIEEAVGYQYPRTLMDIPVTLRVTPGASNDVLFVRRWNKDLQRFEHRCLRLRYHVLQKRSPNWGELLRKQLSGGGCKTTPAEYQNPLEKVEKELLPGQYAVPRSAHAKWGWVWLG
jgi:hypothetical protein